MEEVGFLESIEEEAIAMFWAMGDAEGVRDDAFEVFLGSN
jgi:hypothetical protein